MPRPKSYHIRLSGALKHKLPSLVWHHYISTGCFVAISKRLAVLRAGLRGWIENGELRLFDEMAGVEVSIPSSWGLIERAAIYSDRGGSLQPQQRQREIEWNYQPRGRSNEIVIGADLGRFSFAGGE